MRSLLRTLTPLSPVVAVGLGLAAFAVLSKEVPAAACPSDDALRARYAEHGADLQALRDLIRAEGVASVGDDRVGDCRESGATWSCAGARALDEDAMLRTVGLSRERFDRYRGLLHAVGAVRVVRRPGGTVDVVVNHDAGSPLDASKALIWAPIAPAPLVADTDVARSSRTFVRYARVADGWYIGRTGG
jgi:hypothetical protein